MKQYSIKPIQELELNKAVNVLCLNNQNEMYLVKNMVRTCENILRSSEYKMHTNINNSEIIGFIDIVEPIKLDLDNLLI